MIGAVAVLFLSLLAVLVLVTLIAMFAASVVMVARLGRRILGDRVEQPVAPPAPDPPRRIGGLAGASAWGRARPRSQPRAGGGQSRSGSRTELEALAAWRYRQLLQVGLDPVTAAEASLAGIDVAAVRGLVERGCSAPLALQILG
ncbi:MAG: hypothetical protein ACRDM1_14580 [Gaiellaceae bacterium]